MKLWAQHNQNTNVTIVRMGTLHPSFKFRHNNKNLKVTIDGSLPDPFIWYSIKEVIFKVTKDKDGFCSGLARKLTGASYEKVYISGIHIVMQKEKKV